MRSLLVLSAALAAGTAVVAPSAQAQTISPLPGSTVQNADGNQADADGLLDWQGLNAAGRVISIDDPTGSSDTAWGGSHPETSPDDWATVNSNLNGQVDLRAGYNAREVTSGGAFLHFAFGRPSGTQPLHTTWELNQRATTWRNRAGWVIPCRITGDVLVTATVDSAKILGVQGYLWTTSTADSATGCARTGTLTSFGTPPAGSWQGAGNSATTTNFLTGPSTHNNGEFGELGLTYDAALGTGCTRFVQLQLKSRENMALNSTMKDRLPVVPTDVGGCAIAMDKTGPAKVRHNDSITYTYRLTNTAQRPLSAVSVTDPGCSTMGAFTHSGGDADTLLEVGETWTATCTTTMSAHAAGETNPIDTTATASGANGSDVVSATDGHAVEFIHPAVSLDLRVRRGTSGVYVQGPIQVVPGDSIGLQFDAVNTGETALTAPNLDAAKCDAGTLLGPSGDANTNGVLDVAETWRYTCKHVVVPADGDPIVFANGFTGNDPQGSTTSSTDTATADVLNPAIALSGEARRLPSGGFVTGPVGLHANEQLQHRLTATNPGDVALTPTLTPTGCDSGTLSARTGDANGDGRLDPGESWVWTCTQSAGSAPADPLPFSASVSGVDALGTTRTATTSRSSDILKPAIAVNVRSRKGSSGTFVDGPLSVHNGDVVQSEIIATSSGDTPLTVSTSPSNCSSLNGPTGDADGDDQLDPGESWRWTCSRTITSSDSGSQSIAATVTGTDAADSTVSATDSVTLNVSQPAIAADAQVRRGSSGSFSDGPILIREGETLEARVLVTNTGDVALTPSVTPTGCSGLSGSTALLAAGESRSFTCSQVIAVGNPDPATVSFAVSGNDGLGVTVSASDAASADVLKPAISVSVPEGASTVRAGSATTRTIIATNPGDAPLGVALVTSACDSGTLTAPSGDVDGDSKLDPGETWTWTCAQTATPSAGDPLPFTATVTGTDGLGTQKTASASRSTDVLNPALTTSLTASAGAAHVGDTVTFSQSVGNPGDAALTLSGSPTRCDSGTLGNWTGTGTANGKLDPGETWTRTCTHLVTDADPDPLSAIASMTGTDDLGGTTTAAASATVDVAKPAIAVDLRIRRGSSGTFVDGPITAHDGDTVNAEITVTNSGDVPLTPGVSATGCSGLTGAAGSLAAGATRTYTCSRTVDADPVTISATAAGTDSLGTTVSAVDQARSDTLRPSVAVSMPAGASAAHVGDQVTRTISVTNPGDTPLDVSLSLNACDSGTLSVRTGDTDGDGKLDTDETWTWNCKQTATVAAGDPLTFTATATATDGLGAVRTATTTRSTDVLHPAVTLDVSASAASVRVGDVVTLTYTATSTGDAPLSLALTAGGCDGGTLGAWSGDTDADGLLDPNETWTRTCTRVAGSSDADPLVLGGTLTGTDALGTTVQSTDTTTVDIAKPAIAVDVRVRRGSSGSFVDGPITAHDADTLEAQAVVTNTGDVPLAPIVTPTGCSGLSSGQSGSLAAGASRTYTCARTVDADPVTISITAAGTDPLGTTVSAVDQATSDTLRPNLSVAVAPGASAAHVGDQLTRTITAANTGDTPLVPVVTATACDSGTLSGPSGDGNGDSRLDMNETWSWTCKQTVTAAAGDPAAFTATVTGTDALGGQRSTSATRSTDVLHPAIELAVSANRSVAHVGDTIALTYVATTSGDAPLTLTLSAPACDPGSLGTWTGDADGDDRLGPAETWTRTCTRDLSGADGDPFSATGTLTGVDELGASVQSSAAAVVDVAHPAISTDVQLRRGSAGSFSDGPIDVYDGDMIEARILVSNTGDVALTPAVAPTGCSGLSGASDALAAGATRTYTCARTADADPVSISATATGTDAGGVQVSSTDAAGADVLHPQVTVDQQARVGAGAWSDGPVLVRTGQSVQLRFTATTTGDAPLTPALNTPICDDGTRAAPTGDADGDGKLETGETWTWTCTHAMLPGDADPLISTAAINGTDALGSAVTDDDQLVIDAIVTAATAEVTVSRNGTTFTTGPLDARLGDTLTIRAALDSTSDLPVSVAPSLAACDAALGAPTGDTDGDGELDPDETWRYECTRTLTAGDGDPYSPAFRADIADGLGGTATATDDARVDVLHPAATTTLQARRTSTAPWQSTPLDVRDGDTVRFRWTATNTGDTPLTLSATTPPCDTGTTSPTSGDTNGDGLLDPGETWTTACRRVVVPGDADQLTRTYAVTGTDILGTSVSSSSSVDLRVHRPAVTLTVTARPDGNGVYSDTPLAAHVGDVVDYRAVLDNTGNTALTVSFPIAVCNPGVPAGDTSGNGRLDPDETWTWECERTIDTNDLDPMPGAFAATATDLLGTGVSATDAVEVDILGPVIQVDGQLRRTGGTYTQDSVAVHAGDTVEYRFTVTNTGDADLENITFADDECNAGTLTAPAGDAGTPEVLEIGERWTYECSHLVSAADPDPLDSTVTVTGKDVLGTQVDSHTDVMRADRLDPDVDAALEQRRGAAGAWTASGIEAHAGDDVEYRWTLTNPGDAPLTIAVTGPACDDGTTSDWLGDANDDGLLDPGETWTRTCLREVLAGDGDPRTASLAVTGTDELGGQVAAGASADTDRLDPALELTTQVRRQGTSSWNTSGVQVHDGDTLEYRFSVTNVGDAALSVALTAPRCDVAPADQNIAPGATVLFTCTDVADGDDPLVAAASATGTDALGGTSTDTDSVSVDVLRPGVELALTAAATQAHAGDGVQLTLTATNSGDAQLTVTPTAASCAGTLDAKPLAPGASTSWTCVRAVDADPVLQSASVSGEDALGAIVTASDSASIDRLDPAVTVDLEARREASGSWSTGPIEARPGDTVQLRWTATNTGDAPLDVGIAIPLCDTPPTGTIALAVGATHTATCAHAVTAGELEDPHVFRVTATGTDALGAQVSAGDELDVDVLEPALQLAAELRRQGDAGWRTSGVEAHEGDTLEYRFSATNVGDAPLIVGLAAPRCDVAPANQNAPIGATVHFTCTDVVDEDDPVVAAATATGTDQLGGTASAGASVSADVLHPSVALAIEPAAGQAHAGDIVAMTLKATNTGDAALTVTPAATSCTGTLNAKPLAPGTSTSWTCDRVIDADPVLQTASVTGEDALGATVTANDSASVDRLDPAVDVALTARRGSTGPWSAGPIEARTGDTLELRWLITNTGDAPLDVVAVLPQCDKPPTGTVAVAAGATREATCERLVTTDDDDPLSFAVSATGTDALGRSVTANDGLDADLLHPGVALVAEARRQGETLWRTAGLEAHEGDTLEYRFSATNTGDAPLTATLGAPRCDGAPAGRTIAAGATVEFSCTDIADTGDPIVAGATVTGLDALGTAVSDSASVNTDVLHPAIALTVVPTAPHAHAGDTVTMTLRAENTGDAVLVATPSATSCAGTLPVRTLPAGASTTWTCERQIDADPVAQTASVSGEDALGAIVTDTDTATVDRLDPAITVALEARRVADGPWHTGSLQVREGDEVELRWAAENTGDASLAVAVTVPACDSPPSGSAAVAAGAIRTGSCVHTVTSGDADPIVLAATATGADVLGREVTDGDRITADILRPAVSVAAEARRAGTSNWLVTGVEVRRGDTLELRFSATNTGDTELNAALASAACDAPVAPGAIAPGATRRWTCEHVVTAGDPDPLHATGTVTATDGLETTVSGSADVAADVLTPRIAITVSADRERTHAGDSVEIRVKATNTGDTPVSAAPSVPGCTGTLPARSLALGAETTWTCDRTITADTDDPLDQTAGVVATDALGGTDTRTGEVRIDRLDPDLALTVEGRRAGTDIWRTGAFDARPGDTIELRWTAANTGDTPLDVTVVPAGCAVAERPELAAGANATGTCSRVVRDSDGDPATLAVTATGTDALGATVTRSDEVDAELLHPAAALELEGRRAGTTTWLSGTVPARAGEDTLEVRFTARNTGDAPLTPTLASTICNPGTMTEPSGDSDGDGRLDPSETWVASCTHAVVRSDLDPTTVRGVLTVEDATGTVLERDDAFTLDRVGAVVSLDKQVRRVVTGTSAVQGPIEARVGDTLEYRYGLQATGDTALAITLTDPGCDTGTLSAPAGDTDGDGLLDPGERWAVTCRHLVQAEDGDPLTTIAHVIGRDILGHEDEATDAATVDIIEPGITVDAQARRGASGGYGQGPVEVLRGEEIGQRFVIGNSGDVPLAVALVNSGCDAGTATAPAGDADGDRKLDPSETWTVTCRHRYTEDDPDPLDLEVTVEGTDSTGGTVQDRDTVRAQLPHPALTVTKTLRHGGAAFAKLDRARAGDMVELRHTLENTGNTALVVDVSDPACDAGTQDDPSGDADGDGRLDRNETWHLHCSRVLQADDDDPYRTTVRANATDALGGTATASDTAAVDIIGPVMAVEVHERRRTTDEWVTGPLTARMGDTLQYRFRLRNTGDSPMQVGLDHGGRCDAGTLHGPEGDDGDERLSPRETWVYECTHVIESGAASQLYTRVRATGTDVLGDSDSAEAIVSVDVLKPGIGLRKLVRRGAGAFAATTIDAREGETLEYRYELVNTGDTALDVALNDPACDPGTLRAPSGDADGDRRLDIAETWVVGCFDTLSATERGEHVTEAVATGTDRLNGTVTARDATTARVAAASADLEARMRASRDALRTGEDVTFTLTAVNHGPSAAADAALSVVLPAGLRLRDAGGCAPAGEELRCALGRLAAGASAQATVVATARAAGEHETVTRVASATADPTAANDEARATVQATTPPASETPKPGTPAEPAPPAEPASPAAPAVRRSDIVVDVTPGSGSRRVGGVLTYLITVANDGPDTATGVALTSTLSGAGKVLSVKPTTGRCAVRTTIECALGTLRHRGRVTIAVRVKPRLPGKLTLTASAASRLTDPEPASNRDAGSARLKPKPLVKPRRAARRGGR